MVAIDSSLQLDWKIESAGTWAESGKPATEFALKVMHDQGLSLKTHRSRQVNDAILANFALILTMEPGQKEALQTEFPKFAGKIFMLSEMAGVTQPVNDPMGQSLNDYELVAKTIRFWLEKGKLKIYKLAANR